MVIPITRNSNLVDVREDVTSMSLTESATGNGLRHNQEFDIVFNANETRYFLYSLVDETNIAMALQKRIFKSQTGGAELEILWNVTSFDAGTEVKVYNQYNKYNDTNLVKVSEITNVVGGEVRESDFLIDTGGIFFSNGDLSDTSGFRVYEPGTYFIAKVTNTHTGTNRIILAYNWIEVPNTFLRL